MNGLELRYFILKPVGGKLHNIASRAALDTYAKVIRKENPALATDIEIWTESEQEKAFRSKTGYVVSFPGKICDEPESGCDYDCMECEVPTVEPEYCEDCESQAEEDGVEYEPNFTHKNGCWTCENCRGAV